MRKKILFLIVFSSISVYSQIYNGNGGGTSVLPNSTTTNLNVGIGTDNPEFKLDVDGDFEANQGAFTSELSDGFIWPVGYPGGYINDSVVALSAGSRIGSGPGYKRTRMLNFFDFPQSNRHVKSKAVFGLEDRADFGRFRYNYETGGFTEMLMMNKIQETFFRVFDDGNDNISLVLSKPNSFVGIGTSSFVDSTDVYRLSVNGAIRAHRVKVYTDWADYVFYKNYELPKLEEVEEYIENNGHLKDIPSAEEVEKNGIELGEMNKLLLQKIEELTLYVIELNKEIKELKSQK